MYAMVELARHKLDIAAVERMEAAGILGPEERIELIDGELIDMPPIGEPHAAIVTALNRALVRACGDTALVSPQNPVSLNPRNLPQPDFAILRPRADFYVRARPGPADILMLVEVADSSIRYDRIIKLPLYAAAGIGEVWILDVSRQVLEVYREPAGERYAVMSAHHRGETLSLALAPHITIRLDIPLG